MFCAPVINHCFQQMLMSLRCSIVTCHIASTPVTVQILLLFAISSICSFELGMTVFYKQERV